MIKLRAGDIKNIIKTTYKLKSKKLFLNNIKLGIKYSLAFLVLVGMFYVPQSPVNQIFSLEIPKAHAVVLPSKWLGSYGAQASTSAVRFMAPVGGAEMISSESSAYGIAPTAGTVQKLYVKLDVAPGSGKSYIITFRKELANTALTCTVSDLNTTCTDLINTTTISAGDRIAISITPTGTPTAARLSYIAEFLPTTEGETVLTGHPSGNNISAVNTEYLQLFGSSGGAPTTSESRTQFVVPTSGTLKKLYIRLNTAPGTGASRTFTVRKNGVATSLLVTFSDSTSGVVSNSSDNVTVAAGDLISLQSSVINSPVASLVAEGIVFVPDTNGDFIIPYNSLNTSLSNSAVNYVHLSGINAVNATESLVQGIAWSDFYFKGHHVKLSAAPGAGKSYVTAFRENGSDASTTFAATISGAATTIGSASGSFTPSDGALYNTSFTPSGTPAASTVTMSYLGSTAPTDVTTPTPGNSGTIATASVASHSLTLNWTEATDDISPQGNLQYEVRQSTSNNISSVIDAEANGTITQAYTADISTLDVTGLNLSTTYYFNIIVKDESGNKSIYTTKSDSTTSGTIYYVDNTHVSASNSNAGTSPSLPWLTIGKCASTILSGDTCNVLLGGTYDERVTPANSGTTGSVITYKASTDCVSNNGITIASTCAKVRGFTISSMNYITIQGFEITSQSMSADTTQPFLVTGTNISILNNYIHDTSNSCIRYNNGSNSIRVSGNNMQYCSVASSIQNTNAGPYTITAGVNDQIKLTVQGVDTTITLTPGSRAINQVLSDITTGITGVGGVVGTGLFTISSTTLGPTSSLAVASVANNAYTILGMTVGSGALQGSGIAVTAGGSGGSVGILVENNALSYVSDYFIPSGGDSQGVFRNNRIGPAHSESRAHIDGWQPGPSSDILIEGNVSIDNQNSDNHFLLNQTGASHYIVRFNSTCESAGGIEFVGTGLYFYNNTWHDNYAAALAGGGSGGAMLNVNSAGTAFARNNIWYKSIDPSLSHGLVYQTASAGTIDHDWSLWFGFPDPGDANYTNAEPMIVDEADCDLNLQSGSPAINNGGPLTTVAVADSGTGTSLILTDANFFQPGWAGVEPDWISVGTIDNIVQISSIDYDTNNITLASSTARNDGDSVWLYKDSDGSRVLYDDSPDLGAFEFSESTPPVRSSGLPSGEQTAGATQVTLSLATNENATCKYGTTASTAYASIANTFTTTAGTTHSQEITGLTNGSSYDYYVRCIDTESNANTDDYTISFSVASPSSGGGGGGGGSSRPTPAPSNSTSIAFSNIKLVYEGSTYYVIKDNKRYGVTNPGILLSYGLEFSDGTPAASADNQILYTDNLKPGDGALVKKPGETTVYLIFDNYKHAFTSESVFLGLDYKFFNVLEITTNELDALPIGTALADPNMAHPNGTFIIQNGTIYRISVNKRYGIPTMEVYNSYNQDNSFANVVEANAWDMLLPVGGVLEKRLLR